MSTCIEFSIVHSFSHLPDLRRDSIPDCPADLALTVICPTQFHAADARPGTPLYEKLEREFEVRCRAEDAEKWQKAEAALAAKRAPIPKVRRKSGGNNPNRHRLNVCKFNVIWRLALRPSDNP